MMAEHSIEARLRQIIFALGALCTISLAALAISVVALVRSGQVPSPAAAAPAPAAQAQVTPAAADVGLTREDIAQQPIDIPAWGYVDPEYTCESGSYQVAPGRPSMIRNSVLRAVQTNLDGDPELETAALLACDYGSGNQFVGQSYQVVALERNAAGKIVTLGQILKSTFEMRDILEIRPLEGGGITVELMDRFPNGTKQARASYRWMAGTYTKVS